MKPKIFLDASHWLVDGTRNGINFSRHGICDAINAMLFCGTISEADHDDAIELLSEYFKPYEKVLYWWHGPHLKDSFITPSTQEERFIALCFLYEIAKDMQND